MVADYAAASIMLGLKSVLTRPRPKATVCGETSVQRNMRAPIPTYRCPINYSTTSSAIESTPDGMLSPASWLQLLCWWLPLETSTEHSAKSKGTICPIALWSGGGCYLLNASAQSKHDSRPYPFGWCFLMELRFQASLEHLGIGFLVFSCGWVQEYGSKSSQFPANCLSRPRILAYWHLPHPAIESTTTGQSTI